jgi:CheY-like chemotaxis protein
MACLISGMEGARLTATVADGAELLQKLRQEECLVLLGLRLPGAPDTARLAQAQFPQRKVIMLLEDELTRFR